MLQALAFRPTGAIVAAPTTSLPETTGSERNWDYRYSWVGDASFTIQALWVAACPEEAEGFFDFMATATATSLDRGADRQIMFGIGGERDLTERHLPHLGGWRDSGPVRVGKAIRLADRLAVGDRAAGWQDAKDGIAAPILEEGWSDTAKAFTQSFGSDLLDASNLMIPIVGFLPATDHRVLATIDAIEDRLTGGRGLVYRYLAEDGLEGEEGTFLLCTFWLAQALAMSGQPARTRAVFDRAAAFVNDVGLLAEEIDAHSGELLGNFPQAFSHIGLMPPGRSARPRARATEPRVRHRVTSATVRNVRPATETEDHGSPHVAARSVRPSA